MRQSWKERCKAAEQERDALRAEVQELKAELRQSRENERRAVLRKKEADAQADRLLARRDELLQELEQVKAQLPDKMFSDVWVELQKERELAARRAREAERLRAELNRPKPKHAGGRPRVYGARDVERVQELRDKGGTIRGIAAELGLSTGTVQRLLKETQEQAR